MKTIKYLMLFAIALSFGACDTSDSTDDEVKIFAGPSFDDTAAGTRLKAFYEKYGVYCQMNVPAKQLNYAWTTNYNYSSSSIDYEYEEADPNYVVKAIDFLENEVMKNFPIDVFNTYVGMNIALEGRMYTTVETDNYLNYEDEFAKYYDVNSFESYKSPNYGFNGSRYMMLAPVGEDFDNTDKNTLKRKWTELIFTEALKNLPNPDAFEQANTQAWKAYWYFYDVYLVGKENHSDDWYNGGTPYKDGVVEPGVIMSTMLFDGYDDEDNQTGYYAGNETFYEAAECLPAFAAYVAYIMYAPASEKNFVRSENQQIIENERLVKEYCKTYLNWDIPELGE